MLNIIIFGAPGSGKGTQLCPLFYFVTQYIACRDMFQSVFLNQVFTLGTFAGTGRYSVALANEGYDVTAVELVKYNLGILKSKNSAVKAYQGNALKLKRFEADTFDVTLLFGPMYHLHTKEEQLKALSEARRVTKKDGIILVAYCMNEYSVLTYGFKEGHVKESLAAGKLSEDFQVLSNTEDLYRYMRLDDINALNEKMGLKRIKIISPDGPSDFMRPVLNSMDEETFENLQIIFLPPDFLSHALP